MCPLDSVGMTDLLIISDAWGDQVNGVVTTLTRTQRCLRERGYTVEVIGPDRFRSIPMPGYAEIELSILPYRQLSKLISEYAPLAIHISTEGPLGWAARRYCLRHGLAFSTSFHTRFPDYLRARLPIPTAWSWAVLRQFHRPSRAVMTATQGLADELASRGFKNMHRWSRGVDLQDFSARIEPIERDKPVLIYMGRVAVEKNIEDFLELSRTRDEHFVVVGDGPARDDLESRYPNVEWRGYQSGQVLRDSLAEADAFVFPSRTDTFGLVMIEAMACGTPVAAYPEQGPLEIVQPGQSGGLASDLNQAVDQALACDRSAVRARAEQFSWANATDQFWSGISPNCHGDVIETS